MPTTLTTAQQDGALNIIAAWLGTKGYGTWTPCGTCATCVKLGDDRTARDKYECDTPLLGPAPTGRAAARSALGPELNPEWDWPSSGPTPTILLEGGTEGWAYRASVDQTVVAQMAAIGVFAEPYASYALCLYPA